MLEPLVCFYSLLSPCIGFTPREGWEEEQCLAPLWLHFQVKVVKLGGCTL
jgi:hypothetical protein